MAATFWFDGHWTNDEPRLIGPADHSFWQSSMVFDGARAFRGLVPDLDLHAGVDARHRELFAQPR